MMDAAALRFAIFGLTISSSWANGHATPWRSLLKGLNSTGHHATFFERDVEYYAAHRDLPAPEFCDLVLYSDWSDVLPRARACVADADVAIVTSYCADSMAAIDLVLSQRKALRVFYDMDTPITLAAFRSGQETYVQPRLVPEFDLVLSFTGGPILQELQDRWGAKRTAPLYGSVDPDVHQRVPDPPDAYRCALGYLGTYAPDRQPALETLLVQPARRRPQQQFLVVGSLYPSDIEWPPNARTAWHLDPQQHAAFYSASRLTLSITRKEMLKWGYTPSGRLFEAAACGTPVLTDLFPGVECFFEPGDEILLAADTSAALAAIDRRDAELRRIGVAARERAMAQHTGAARARELVSICSAVPC